MGNEYFTFRYFKLDRKYYFGFIRKNNFFIATPEKAILDSLYLIVLGKYKLDASAIDWSKISKIKLTKILKKFPEKISKLILSLCKI